MGPARWKGRQCNFGSHCCVEAAEICWEWTKESFLTCSNTCYLSDFPISANPIVKQLYFVLIFISPIIGKVEHLSVCLWTTFTSCYKIFLLISVS